MKWFREGQDEPLDNKQQILGTIEESIMSSIAALAKEGACGSALVELRILISGLSASLWSTIVLSIRSGKGDEKARSMLDQMDGQINEHLDLIHKIAIGFAEGKHRETLQ